MTRWFRCAIFPCERTNSQNWNSQQVSWPNFSTLNCLISHSRYRFVTCYYVDYWDFLNSCISETSAAREVKKYRTLYVDDVGPCSGISDFNNYCIEVYEALGGSCQQDGGSGRIHCFCKGPECTTLSQVKLFLLMVRIVMNEILPSVQIALS